MNICETNNNNEQDELDDLGVLMRRYSESVRSNRSVSDIEDVEGVDNQEETRKTTKRNREMDEEEVWTTVRRKGKLFARATSTDETTRIPENKIEICVTCTEVLPRQFKLAKMLKAHSIQNVFRVKYINDYKVLIQFSTEESAEALYNSKVFNENGYRCQKTLEISQSYGVIKNVDLDLTEEEIMESLECDTTVILGVKRLKRRSTLDGKWQDGEAIRICVKGSSLPSYVKVFDTRVNIEPYVFPVTQCSRCWRYGHVLRMCPAYKIVCPKCSGNHNNCETTKFKCNNCGGKHMALSKTCPIFIRERKIRELMAEFNCSFKRALTLYVPPTPPEPPRLERDFPDLPSVTKNFENHHGSSSVASDANDTPRQRETYAKIVKQTQHKDFIHKKNRKKSKKENSYLDETNFDIISEESEDENELQKDPETEERLDNKRKITWSVLWKKIQQKLTQNNLSWEEKIKGCLGIIYKSVVSFARQYLSYLPCFAFLSQYGP